MDAFGIEQDGRSAGEGRYASGLITLPDGQVRPIEEVACVDVRAGSAQPLDRAGAVVGGLRGALAASLPASLPLRLAFSTVRAGLGVIEEGLRPAPAGAVVEIAFSDGSTLTARMMPETAAMIGRDAEIARGVLARRQAAGPSSALMAPEPAPEIDATPDDALTSIFRYEKRNGRLRRMAMPVKAPEG